MPRAVNDDKHRDLAARGLAAVVKEGLHSASMSDIASRLGVKRSTLYWYFGGVEELVDVAAAQAAERFVALAQASFAASDSPFERFGSMLDAVVEIAADPIAPTVQMRVDLAGQLFGDAAVDRVRAAIFDGVMQPCDAVAIVGTCRAVAAGVLATGGHSSLDARRITRFALDALIGPRAEDDKLRTVFGYGQPRRSRGDRGADIAVDDDACERSSVQAHAQPAQQPDPPRPAAPAQPVRPRGTWLELD